MIYTQALNITKVRKNESKHIPKKSPGQQLFVHSLFCKKSQLKIDLYYCTLKTETSQVNIKFYYHVKINIVYFFISNNTDTKLSLIPLPQCLPSIKVSLPPRTSIG